MSIYFSKSTSGFYDTNIHKTIPDDCVELSQEDYLNLLDGQSKGKVIGSDSDGRPVLKDSLEATAEQNKLKAISLLRKTDWVNQPDVQDSNITPHLLNAQEFIAYRIEIRKIAINPVEGNLNWPTLPSAQWSN